MIDGVLKSRECIPVQHLAPRLVAGLTAVVVLMSTSLLLCLLDLLALRFLQTNELLYTYTAYANDTGISS